MKHLLLSLLLIVSANALAIDDVDMIDDNTNEEKTDDAFDDNLEGGFYGHAEVIGTDAFGGHFLKVNKPGGWYCKYAGYDRAGRRMTGPGRTQRTKQAAKNNAVANCQEYGLRKCAVIEESCKKR